MGVVLQDGEDGWCSGGRWAGGAQHGLRAANFHKEEASDNRQSPSTTFRRATTIVATDTRSMVVDWVVGNIAG